jgi:hypothetical protein
MLHCVNCVEVRRENCIVLTVLRSVGKVALFRSGEGEAALC